MQNLQIPLPLSHSGKVRETYDIPRHLPFLLMDATDRISTHNVVHTTVIPQKGQILTALSVFWTLDVLKNIPTHLVAYGKEIYNYLPFAERGDLHLHAIIVKRMSPDPYEYVWRRYLTGSLYELYQKKQDPYGLALPQGLKKLKYLNPLVFTPTDKSETDDPCLSSYIEQKNTESTRMTKEVFLLLETYLLCRGITIIGMKTEADKGILVDEWGTGDCSRMAYTSDLRKASIDGLEPLWLDKEIARQIAILKWNGGPRVPLSFSDEETARIIARYHEAFEAITDMSLSAFQKTYME